MTYSKNPHHYLPEDLVHLPPSWDIVHSRFKECPNNPDKVWVLSSGGYILKDKVVIDCSRIDTDQEPVTMSLDDLIEGRAREYPGLAVIRDNKWVWLRDASAIFPTLESYKIYLRQNWMLNTCRISEEEESDEDQP